MTQIYNPANTIPATVIVDSQGVIQGRFNGVGSDPGSGVGDLSQITHIVDLVLAGRPTH